MKNNLQAKRIVITAGEVQLPIKVGEEVCYRYDGHLMWTDRVHRILEVAADYVRIETTSYYYTIEKKWQRVWAVKRCGLSKIKKR